MTKATNNPAAINFSIAHKAMTAIVTLQSLRASFASVGAETTELLLSAGVEIEAGAKGNIKYTGRINGHSATQC